MATGGTAETKETKDAPKVLTEEEQAEADAEMQKRHDQLIREQQARVLATAEPPTEEEQQAAREKQTEDSQKP